MICQKCGKGEANTYIKAIVNGKMVEYALCSNCAMNQSGLTSNFTLSNMLKGFFSDSYSRGDKCSACGVTFDEIVNTGMVGCSHCYECFFDKLLPSIQRIHGSAVNKGKAPNRAALAVAPQKQELSLVNTLENKRNSLNKAIFEQRFEDAVVLRDEIKKLEEGGI